ncbi:nicalin [Echinops telfairi]|uniref:BOS complex subunit NCLN n=1 Tax=Echinops telfairi TaxID=9371 RepID=A0ABM1VMV7_ECHTE|nr:nicalin [Echinops telfairi]
MNATGSLAASPETCQWLAAEGHSRLILLHYNYSGRLVGRGDPEDRGQGVLRCLFVAVSCLVVLENLLVLAAITTRMRSRRWVFYCLVNITLSDLLTGVAYLANVLLWLCARREDYSSQEAARHAGRAAVLPEGPRGGRGLPGAMPAGPQRLPMPSLPAVLLLVAPPLPAADAAHEFTVYRMQQYDLQGQPYGTRNAVLNTEARTMDADVLSRRCVLMRLVDFSYEQYQKALRQSAGAVVIILPPTMSAVPQDIIRQFMAIEPEMLALETIVPVYFAVEDEALLAIYQQTQAASASQGSASAAEVLLHTATANGFQMVTSGAQSKAVSDWLITSVEGRLTGLGGEDLPTIVIVAHYDAFGVAPWLSHGADSNGSGISVLLELARLFSRLYTYKRTHAAYNLLFFASGGGKFNYQGTKRWLEDNLDHTDSSLLQDNVAFVLCLDTLGRGSSLHLHVSKPPREGTLQYAFLRELHAVTTHQFPEVRFSMVHKKINLAEDTLAWEHERFAIRRLPAFTLSHLESHRDGQRSSIMDVRSRVDAKTLTQNTRIVAEALTRVIYNLTEKGTPPDIPVFTEQMQIQQEQLASVMDWLAQQPRAAQLVDKDGPFLSTLEHCLSRYLKDVRQHHVKADKRDPEFVFYDQLKQVMNAYRVKPAIFDLLLAVCIGAYLGMAYTAVQHFDLLYKTVQRVLLKVKAQ